MSRSSSRSSKSLMALGRSFGKTCRRSCTDETCFAGGDGSPDDAVENRSRVACSVRSRPMLRIMPPPTSASNFEQRSLPRLGLLFGSAAPGVGAGRIDAVTGARRLAEGFSGASHAAAWPALCLGRLGSIWGYLPFLSGAAATLISQ
jgi:hypothetical protein